MSDTSTTETLEQEGLKEVTLLSGYPEVSAIDLVRSNASEGIRLYAEFTATRDGPDTKICLPTETPAVQEHILESAADWLTLLKQSQDACLEPISVDDPESRTIGFSTNTFQVYSISVQSLQYDSQKRDLSECVARLYPGLDFQTVIRSANSRMAFIKGIPLNSEPLVLAEAPNEVISGIWGDSEGRPEVLVLDIPRPI